MAVLVLRGNNERHTHRPDTINLKRSGHTCERANFGTWLADGTRYRATRVRVRRVGFTWDGSPKDDRWDGGTRKLACNYQSCLRLEIGIKSFLRLSTNSEKQMKWNEMKWGLIHVYVVVTTEKYNESSFGYFLRLKKANSVTREI